VKFTKDLSPRKMRWTRGSETERFGSIGAAVFGKSIWILRKNGGVLMFSFHLVLLIITEEHNPLLLTE